MPIQPPTPTVAITGAAGFIGTALTQAILASGGRVRAMARPGSSSERLQAAGVTWTEADVTRPESLRGYFNGVDAVIHAAGMLGQAGVPESEYFRLHRNGTENVLAEIARSGEQPRVLYISSPGVLGPISGSPADETTPLAPSNPYERSKAAAEEVAQRYAAQGLPVVIARPEFLYGPGDRHVLGLFRAVQRGLFFYIGSGNYTCHPTYVADAVDGLVRCLWRGRPGEIYHITGPQPVTFRELGSTIAAALGVRPPWLRLPRPVALLAASVLEKALGSKAPLTRTGVAFFSEDRRFSWQKAHEQLAYTPAYDLATGVQHTVDWYRQHNWL